MRVDVSPPVSSLLVGATVSLTAVPRDAAGNALSGRAVSWSSSNQQVATVSSFGLVSGIGPGGATITATSEGKTGSAAITVAFPDFNPASNTSLSGSQSFSSVNIPAGVQVTATSDLVVTATGAVTIAGTLSTGGICRAITVTAEGGLTVTGTVSTECPAPGGGSPAPALKLFGKGGIEFTGATVSSSGDLVVSNDPTLQDSDFPSAPPTLIPNDPGPAAVTAGICSAGNTSFLAKPLNASNGTDGQTGGSGANGGTWVLQCRGELRLTGGVLVQGQDGGNGGAGSHQSAVAASARGGKGGNGGRLKVRATGPLIVSGTSNTLRSGDGGDGGSAIGVGLTNPAPPKAPSATATAGDGGEPGLIEARAFGVIDVRGVLTLEVGDGGWGGQGSASAADGVDAGTQPAQIGGDATAAGGKGGSSPDKMLQGQNVLGLANIVVLGGIGGKGGGADGFAGIGGKGNRPFKPGADGGNLAINGAKGGDSQIKNQFGAGFGVGGRGGDASFYRGNGGDGWSDCLELPFESGGRGGNGGDASGNSGLGGAGGIPIPGNNGDILVSDAANGGDGGAGEPPGLRGVGGRDDIGSNGPRTDNGPTFEPGSDGAICPARLEVRVAVVPVIDPGRFNLTIDGGTLASNVQDGGTTGERQVTTGTHSVGETAGTATNLADYGSAISCKDNNGAGNVVASGAGSGPLNVMAGQGADIVCIVTNVRNIETGFDLWDHSLGPNFMNFNNRPIPAGFFSPGSDPFTGNVPLGGIPIDRPMFGTTDTKVQRLSPVRFGGPEAAQAAPIPIEIVALNLVSVQPITVTYNGGTNPELWNVEVTLSPQHPQQQGLMTLNRTSANGGTFSVTLPVQPRFVFKRVPDNFTVVLQNGDFGPALVFNAPQGDYQFVCPPGAGVKKVPAVTNENFCPGTSSTSRVPILFQAFKAIGPGVVVLEAQFAAVPPIP